MKQNNRLKRQTLAFAMGLSLLASCSSTETTSPQETSSSGGSGEASPSGSAEKLSIVTTTFPEYDWVREILGDQIDSYNLTLLIDNGVDLHSFNFDFDDVILIGEADLFLHNGGESVSLWVDDVLDQVQDSSVKTINLLESIGSHGVDAPHFHYDDVEEEHDHDHEEEEHDHDHEEEEHDHDHEEEEHDHDHEEEDHDHEEEHDHDHEEDTHDHEEEETHDHEEEETHDHEEEAHDHDHDEAGHEDEHYWMSLTIAQNLCAVITDEICALDPENEDTYRSNLTAYTEKLSALDEEYQTMVDAASSNVIVVADRFPFVYLTEDYGLEYYAAFSGCSAETEASAGTIVALTERVEEFALSVVVTTETGHEIAQTIVDNASGDQDILALDSLQSTSSNSGDTYLSVMASNLDVLRDILG